MPSTGLTSIISWSTASLSNARSTLSWLFAASGLLALEPMMALMCAGLSSRTGLSACSARKRSRILRRFACVLARRVLNSDVR
jgi:hypothetical protein